MRGSVTMHVSNITRMGFDENCVDYIMTWNFDSIQNPLLRNHNSLTSTSWKEVVSFVKLVNYWSTRSCEATVQCTSQQKIRKISIPTLSQRFCTNGHMLFCWYYCHPMLINTMFSDIYFFKNNNDVQLFARVGHRFTPQRQH